MIAGTKRRPSIPLRKMPLHHYMMYPTTLLLLYNYLSGMAIANGWVNFVKEKMLCWILFLERQRL